MPVLLDDNEVRQFSVVFKHGGSVLFCLGDCVYNEF